MQRGRNERGCQHQRIKKNYPFGRKSKPMMTCKDCGKSVKPNELKDLRKRRGKDDN
jgi:hypothetical protein